MNLQKCVFLLFFTIYASIGCKEHDKNIVLKGKTMGTFWYVKVIDFNFKKQKELRIAIQRILDDSNNELSTWKKTSILSRFNTYQGTHPKPISSNMADIIIQCLRIGKKTYGAMDITIGPLVNLWGFGPIKAPLHMPKASEIKKVKTLIGLQYLRLIHNIHGQWLQKTLPKLCIDLSTVGEGYATDQISRLMKQKGISNYLVSVGGAVLSNGLNEDGSFWKIGIQQPTDQNNIAMEHINLHGNGISTAGSYRNYYSLDGNEISHIINPKTGMPIKHGLVSVSVIAPTALEADAWDTGLMVLGEEEAKKLALKEHLAVYLISRKKDIDHVNKFTSWISPQFRAFLIH